MVFRHCWALHHTWIRSLNFIFSIAISIKPSILLQIRAARRRSIRAPVLAKPAGSHSAIARVDIGTFPSSEASASSAAQQRIWFKANLFLPFSLSLSPAPAGLEGGWRRGCMSEVPKRAKGGSRHGAVPACLFPLFSALDIMVCFSTNGRSSLRFANGKITPAYI